MIYGSLEKFYQNKFKNFEQNTKGKEFLTFEIQDRDQFYDRFFTCISIKSKV